MLKQRDHRGKRFTIGHEDATDEIAIERSRRAEALERAKAVAGPAGKHPEVEVLER